MSLYTPILSTQPTRLCIPVSLHHIFCSHLLLIVSDVVNAAVVRFLAFLRCLGSHIPFSVPCFSSTSVLFLVTKAETEKLGSRPLAPPEPL